MIFDWQAVTIAVLAAEVTSRAGSKRTSVVAVDGHSSSGKSSLGRRLQAALPSAGLLHTDDLAWHHGVFSWDTLLVGEVLPVVLSGAPLRYRPPAWVERGRDGEVALPGGLAVLIVEGVGASQASVRQELDVAVWVETREPTRLARDAVRVAAGETSPADYLSWMAEENAHMIVDQPWLSADMVVSGDDRSGPDDGTVRILART